MILSYYVGFLHPYQFHLAIQSPQRIFLMKYVKDKSEFDSLKRILCFIIITTIF